jgi:predicted XRE-type DNA-binding protein
MPKTTKRRTVHAKLVDTAALGKEIKRIIDDRELTQTEAARVIDDAPSQISLISTGKLKGFSPERLIRILTKLGRDVEIRISKAKGKSGKVRLSIRQNRTIAN